MSRPLDQPDGVPGACALDGGETTASVYILDNAEYVTVTFRNSNYVTTLYKKMAAGLFQNALDFATLVQYASVTSPNLTVDQEQKTLTFSYQSGSPHLPG